MIEPVAGMFQSPEPWPCWKTKTTIPKARGERDEVQHDRLDREHERAERPREQDQRQEQDEPEHVGEAAEQGVEEVAVDGGQAGQRAVRPFRLALARSIVAWMPGAEPSIVGEALDERVRPLLPSRRRGRSDDAGHCAQLRRDLLGVASVLDEDVERLHHAGTDPGGGELVASGDRRARAGEVLQLRLGRVQLRAEPREHGDDHEADRRDRDRAAEHEARPAAPGAVFGMAAVDEAAAASPGRC